VRLFTAVELGESVRAEAGALSAELRERAGRTAPSARVTWVPDDRMHLTLRFIGEVDDARAEGILRALREPLPVAPFAISFGDLGAFPPKGAPRVIWIGVTDGRDAAVRTESAISDRLHALGVPREDRPYRPHLTLARVREAAGLRASTLFAGLEVRLGQARVDAITLFQSRLSPKGPSYTVLERTPLRDG
jgi:RNA 2',3'-cyclic 3'-phosphodiesterase